MKKDKIHPYILELANGQVFKGVGFLKFYSLLHKVALFLFELLLTAFQAVALGLKLHLALVPLRLQAVQVSLPFTDLFPELHGLVSASLVFKLGLIQLHEALIRELRVTVGLLFRLGCPCQLLGLNGLEFVDFPNHALSIRLLILDHPFQVFLLLLLLTHHAIIPVL